VVRDPVLRRTLQRSLCGNRTRVEFRESLDQGPLPVDAILFLDRETTASLDLPALTARMSDRGRIVVLGGSLGDGELVELLRQRALDHVIADRTAPDEHELAVTSAKLHSGDIFGLEKYLAWGARVSQVEVAGYDEKRAAIEELGRVAEWLGARRRLVNRVQTTADELLMNALYDAPAASAPLAAGSRRLAVPPGEHSAEGLVRQFPEDPRRGPPAAPALLRYGCDGRYLAVSVLDRYGSLDKRALLDAVLRARSELGRPRVNQGGAGLGVYFVLSSVTRFIVNIQPGRFTEVVCLFDVRERGRDAAGWARSLHVFTAA
jgi:hypothetical protein